MDDSGIYDIDIIMATYNGEKYLKQQIDSIMNQNTEFKFRLLISDDGSSDSTLNIIKYYAGIFHNIIFLEDENSRLGPAKRFEFILSKSTAKYIMLCDQDDVWLDHKIEVSAQKLLSLAADDDMPILVHTNLKVVRDDLSIIMTSMHDNIREIDNLSINTALVHNIVTGCTVIMNRKLAEISLPFPECIYMHDWWLYLVSKLYGRVGYIQEPTILYRQHAGNTLGAGVGNNRFSQILSKLGRYLRNNGIKGFYDACFCQAQYLIDLNQRMQLKSSDMKIVQKFASGKYLKNIELKLFVIRNRFLPYNFLNKVSAILRLH